MAEEVRDALEEFLERIPDVQCFTETLKFYAPTCYGECEDAVESLARKLDLLFQGSTIYDAQGRSFNEEKRRWDVEPVKVIEVGHHCLEKPRAKEVAEAIKTYAREADQDFLAIAQSRFYLTTSRKFAEAVERFLG